MKTIEGNLYIEMPEAIVAGISENTIRGARNKELSSWHFIDDPSDRRRVLICYATLKQQYKDLITAKYGNPYQYISASLIKQFLILKPEDSETILNYRCSDGNFLPTKHQQLYIQACQYLNILSSATCKWIKQHGFDCMSTFTDAVISLIKADNLPLPTNYTRLKHKVREYRQDGALCVISKKFGNQNSRKLGELQLAAVAQAYAKANQFGAERIAFEYNLIARSKNWEPITAQAILWNVKQPKFKQQLIGPRMGVSSFRELADFTITRHRPSRPNMLWVGDGTPFELYYRKDGTNEKGHNVVEYWHRKVVYVVIDAYNDIVVGYSIGDTESNALAKLAWRNACVNNGILPDQVKTDRYGLKEMRSYYGMIAKDEDFFTPSAVGNARDKVVEQFFGKIHNAVIRDYVNYSGRNITAKNQPNRDYLQKAKDQFPDEAGVIEQIHECISRWNNLAQPKRDNLSRIQEWKAGDHSHTRALTDITRLEIFGVKHEHTNKLTNKGIVATLEGTNRIYMRFENDFMDTIGTDYQLIYDPLDLSSVLAIGNNGKLKFLLPEYDPMPMALGDTKTGDRTRLNSILTLKKERITLNIQRNADQLSRLDAEGITKIFPLLNNKESIHIAGNSLKQLSAPDTFDTEPDLVPVPVQKQNTDLWDGDID